MKAAILGAGVIGAGWIARFLLHGWDVFYWDLDPRAHERIAAVVAQARTSLSELYDQPLPDQGSLAVAEHVEHAVGQADWVQESLPERLEVKQEIFRQVAAGVRRGVPVASSTSGFKPSTLSRGSAIAEQIVVCHPFNPVYLLPGVEVVPTTSTHESITSNCMHTLRQIGMQPTLVNREIDAHVADRLLEAVWREALWLIRDGVATTAEVDEIIRTSFGLRWAQMGLFETYRIAGGDGGFRHFLGQFGPALQWPWSKLTDVPELSDALIDTLVKQSDEQAAGRSIAQMEAQRDRNLVAILRALKSVGDGAGQKLNEFETGHLVRQTDS